MSYGIARKQILHPSFLRTLIELMASNPGYIYALINYSMPGLVKVGRTDRSPSTRIDELSSATGIPTQFVLVYDILVPDAERAEQLMHGTLTNRGYRVAENREFFNAPIHEVVKLMIELREELESISIDKTGNSVPSSLYSEEDGTSEESLIRKAALICAQSNSVDTLSLQRQLRTGYTRIAKIIDKFEKVGILGPTEQNGLTRKVLLSETDIKRVLELK